MVAAMPHGQALRSWYMGMFQLPWLPEWLLGHPRLSAPLFRSMDTPGTDQVNALLADRWTARATVNWYRAAVRSIAGRSPGPGAVRVPTTYVWSDGDPALGRWAAEHTREWVDADYRFVVLDGVSHWIPDERPEELASLVLDRLAA
jgi:pimeloyl-ACP methyl ester carboxylesterase